MDRHDAKPRRPSLMAGAEPQRPASGAQPARILADMATTPAPRRPRRGRHVRAALAGGIGLLAVAAVGWALLGSGPEVERLPVTATPRVAELAVAEPATATLVDAPPLDNAVVANPFESEGMASAVSEDTASTAAALAVADPAGRAAPAATPNPFNSIVVATARSKPNGVPPRAVAMSGAAARPVSHPALAAQSAPAAPPPAPPRAGGRDAGLLQTLMDNIQQPVEPPRDTRGMDRLARRLDRAPMPDAAPVVVANASRTATPEAVPSPARSAPTSTANAGAAAPIAAAALPAAAGRGGGSAAQQKQTLRALLEQCPATNSVQSQRCRRQMCERAGVDPHRCTRH